MKATNTFSTQSKPAGFSSIINAPATRDMINKSVGDPSRAASLVSTLISTVNASDALKQCDSGTIISAALRGEIGMGLSLAMGQYSIVPYGNKATFQIGAKGLKQMAIRSGKYSAMNFFDVRQGEFKGRDPKTREPKFEWIEDEDERANLPIVGYYGFYVLNEENNNFFQCIYWSHEQILKHADRYSKAFSLEKYNQLIAGQLSPSEAEKLRNGSPWYDLPDSVPHMKMCMKTITIQLLNDGMAPIELQRVINADTAQESSGTPVNYDDGYNVNVVADVTPKPESVQVSQQVATAATEPEAVDVDVIPPEEPKTAQRASRAARSTTANEVPVNGGTESVMDGFFGE